MGVIPNLMARLRSLSCRLSARLEVESPVVPIPGSRVLTSLQGALNQARTEASSARIAGDRAAGRVKQLVAERAEICLQLARHYLPDVRRETIQGTFAEIRSELEAIVARKERSEQEITERLARLDRERANVEQELNRTTERLNRLVEERGRLQQEVAARLKNDADFQQLSQEALAAEAILKRNEERAEEIRREADEKRPAFERSRLFSYLQRRKFGTSEYRYEGLTRRLDRWVANLIGYERARRSYDFLQSTPKLVAEEVERRKREFDQHMARVEAIERRVSDAVGLTPILTQGNATGEERDRLVRRVSDAQAECRRTQQSLDSLRQTHGTHYDEAVERLRKFLASTEGGILEARARQTPETTDDELVRRIREVDRQSVAAAAEADESTERQRTLTTQADGIELLVRRFRQAEFDSERSSFEDGFDADSIVALIRRHGVPPEAAFQRMRTAQKFAPVMESPGGSLLTEVVSSPATAAILHAIVEVAGAMAQQSAARSVERRRGRSWHWDNQDAGPSFPAPSPSSAAPAPSFPSSPSPPRVESHPSPSSPPPSGGFTSGEGF